MALATYSNLTTALADWLVRSDLSSGQIQDLVSLCESRLNKVVRHRRMVTTATLSLSAGTATVAAPSDYLEARTLILESSPDIVLRYMTPETLAGYSREGTTGKPEFYTLVGDNFKVGKTPDANYSVTLEYYAALDLVTDETNWLLTNYPDVYLYGALCEAEPFVLNDNRMPLWKAKFDEGIAELNADGDRSEVGAGSIAARPDIAVV